MLALLSCLYTYGQQSVYDGFELTKNTTATALTNEGLNAILVSNYTKTSINRIVIRPGQPPLQLLNQPVSENDVDKTFRRTQNVPEKIALLLFKTSPIGGYFDTKSVVEVNREQSSSDFYFTETNLVTGNCAITDTIKSDSKEKIIGCSNRNGGLLLITYLESTNTVIVYKKVAGQNVVKTPIEINNDGFGKLSQKIFAAEVKTFADIFKKSSFAVYQNNLRYHPLFHSVRTKAYFQKDKLVFTVNSNNLSTYLITIQLDDFSHKLQRFTQQQEAATAQHSTNSLLIDSLLITAHFNKKQLLLNLFNTATETHLKTLSITSENIDSIATEPIQKTGNFWSKAETFSESFQNFQATSASNQLGLSGYIQEQKLYLMFATPFKQIVTANTLLSLAMSATGTYFVNAAPNTYGYMLVSFPGVRSSTFISFPAALTLPDMNFSSAKGNCTVWDKLQSQLQLRKIEPGNSHFFYMNGYFYVGYMSDRKYRIFRFDERGIE
ncbi:MAG: hypothetical protein EOO14_08405 [Chitinophagaceae bacterium]|nr:MAG: hypothetical protein EOO14_08405 [Chitinophagaceae bacterium]